MPFDGIKTAIIASGLISALSASAMASTPNGGYYEGLSILYPYDPVFCDQNGSLGGPCFGMPGADLFLPKSAPLPPGYKHCRWADIDGGLNNNWYQWEPRTIDLYSEPTKVCYLEDRGSPKDINKLPRDDE